MERCMKTKCKSWTRNKKTKQHLKDAIRQLKRVKPVDENQLRVYELTLLDIETSKDKSMRNSCKNAFCNQGCKDSIFEDGPVNQLPESMKQQYTSKEMRKFWLTQRKKTFGKKKSVLKDGFYHKLTPKTIQRLKKEGAISGCLQKWAV